MAAREIPRYVRTAMPTARPATSPSLSGRVVRSPFRSIQIVCVEPAFAWTGTGMASVCWTPDGPGPAGGRPPHVRGVAEPPRGSDASSSSSAITCCRSAACATASDRPCV